MAKGRPTPRGNTALPLWNYRPDNLNLRAYIPSANFRVPRRFLLCAAASDYRTPPSLGPNPFPWNCRIILLSFKSKSRIPSVTFQENGQSSKWRSSDIPPANTFQGDNDSLLAFLHLLSARLLASSTTTSDKRGGGGRKLSVDPTSRKTSQVPALAFTLSPTEKPRIKKTVGKADFFI